MLVIFVNPQLKTYFTHRTQDLLILHPSTQDTEGLKILFCYVHYMFAGLHNIGHIFSPTSYVFSSYVARAFLLEINGQIG